jgi:hypothetical protein
MPPLSLSTRARRKGKKDLRLSLARISSAPTARTKLGKILCAARKLFNSVHDKLRQIYCQLPRKRAQSARSPPLAINKGGEFSFKIYTR